MGEDVQARRVQAEIERAEGFYTRLRSKSAAWLERRRVSSTVREYLLLLPDLFALLVRLLKDPRIARATKLQLLGAGAYVIAPVDFVPDFFVPLGLTDDTVALAFILSRLVAMMGSAGEDVLYEHWEGRGDVLEQIRRVLSTADRVLNHRIVGWLRGRFGRGGRQ